MFNSSEFAVLRIFDKYALLCIYSLDLVFPISFNEMDYKSDLCCDHTTILSTLIISHAVVIFNMV